MTGRREGGGAHDSHMTDRRLDLTSFMAQGVETAEGL